MGSIERRLARIEAHLGFNKSDKKKSPREQAEEISQGKDSEYHIKGKSLEALEQYAKSLLENFEPENISHFSHVEKEKFLETATSLFNDIKKTDSKDLKKAWMNKLIEIIKRLQKGLGKD